MKINGFSRAMYILAVMALLIGLVLSVSTNGRQIYSMLVVAIVLGAIGLIFQKRKRHG